MMAARAARLKALGVAWSMIVWPRRVGRGGAALGPRARRLQRASVLPPSCHRYGAVEPVNVGISP